MEFGRIGSLHLEKCAAVNVTLNINTQMTSNNRIGEVYMEQCDVATVELNVSETEATARQPQQQQLPEIVQEDGENMPPAEPIPNENAQTIAGSQLRDQEGQDVLKRIIFGLMQDGLCVQQRSFLGECMNNLPPELDALGVADKTRIRSRLSQRIYKIRELIRTEQRRMAQQTRNNGVDVVQRTRTKVAQSLQVLAQSLEELIDSVEQSDNDMTATN